MIHTSIAGSIVLSDDDGNVYGENSTHNEKFLLNDSNAVENTYKTAVIDLRIDYAGNLSTVAEIGQAWAEIGDNDDFVVTVSDTTGYTGTTPNADIVTLAGTSGKKDGVHYGLKFKTSAAPDRDTDAWQNEGTAGTKTNTLAVGDIDLSNPGDFGSLSGSAGSYTATVTVPTVATFYVGIIGIDGVGQATTDTYGCSFAVSGGSIPAV